MATFVNQSQNQGKGYHSEAITSTTWKSICELLSDFAQSSSDRRIWYSAAGIIYPIIAYHIPINTDIYQHLVKDSSQNQIFTIINQFTFVKIINHYLLPSMQSKQSQIHNQKSSQTDFFTKSITSLSQDNNPKLKMNQSSNDPIGMNHIHSQHKRSEWIIYVHNTTDLMINPPIFFPTKINQSINRQTSDEQTSSNFHYLG